MNFDVLLAELGPILGFEDFSKTEDGDVTASFDNIYVTFDYFDGHVFFLTRVGDIPDDTLAAYSFLLHANSFGRMDGYVGITADQNAIIFVTKVPEQLAAAGYVAERLEKHINAAEKLIQGLARISGTEEVETGAMGDVAGVYNSLA